MSDERRAQEEGTPSRRAALIGLIVVLTLVIGGLFLARVLGGVSRIQDCIMSGRTNCSPIRSE